MQRKAKDSVNEEKDSPGKSYVEMQTLKCNQWAVERFTNPVTGIASPRREEPGSGREGRGSALWGKANCYKEGKNRAGTNLFIFPKLTNQISHYTSDPKA